MVMGPLRAARTLLLVLEVGAAREMTAKLRMVRMEVKSILVVVELLL
jgi:hypothetical protein